jgi:chromosome segregation ATPase
MPSFGTVEREKKKLTAELSLDIEELKVMLSDLSIKVDSKLEAAAVSEEVAALKRQVAELEIRKSSIEEQFARERREIEHKAGLLKTQTEQELALGKRDAILSAKEAHFTEHQAEIKSMLQEQDARNRDLIQQVLDVNKEAVKSRQTRARRDR